MSAAKPIIFLPTHPQFTLKNPEGNEIPVWGIIESCLADRVATLDEFKRALSVLRPYPRGFTGLDQMFEKKSADKEWLGFFYGSMYPFLRSLIKRTPELFPVDVYILKQNIRGEVVLTHEQCACLLAHALFRTMPDDAFSFDYLISAHTQLAKLEAIFHYFSRVCQSMPAGVVRFERLVHDEAYDFASCSMNLSILTPHGSGTIEDDGINCLQADFANEFIGGGVLEEGCVQEEIRFGITNPECLCSLLFTDKMMPNEAVLITGPERFSNYTGYGLSTRWKGDHVDQAPRDEQGGVTTQIVAMDALKFRNPDRQWEREAIDRELIKAYTAFTNPRGNRSPIATGNWGCGVFRGDKGLKAVIQLIAASAVKRPLEYFTFGDQNLCEALNRMCDNLQSHNVTVGLLYKEVHAFSARYCSGEEGKCEIVQYLSQWRP